MKILVILFVIILIFFSSFVFFLVGAEKTPSSYDPNIVQVTCTKCSNGQSTIKTFFQPACPIGWIEGMVECESAPPLKCWACYLDGTSEYAYYPSEYHTECPPRHPIGPQEDEPNCGGIPSKPIETRTPIISGNFVSYTFDSAHGYLTTSQIKSILKEHFNNWEDDPYRPGHVCRHMCMQIEQYLEKDFGIDCLWSRGEKIVNGERSTHTWLYILTKDMNNPFNTVFYAYESTNLAWAVPTNDCSEGGAPCGYTQIEINHGNYIYGKRLLKNGEPYIFRVSNYDDFKYINDYCSQCTTYPYQYGPGDPMYDVVLPVSVLQMISIRIFNSDYLD